MTRRPYTARCRFFADRPDVIVRIQWIHTAKGAEPLGIDSAIYPRDWDADKWRDWPLGELWDQYDRPYIRAMPIEGSGRGHYCGTEADYRDGVRWDDPRPPMVYRTDGLPQCCDAPIIRGGGPVVGGRGLVSVVDAVPALGATCITADYIAPGASITRRLPANAAGWVRLDLTGGGPWKSLRLIGRTDGCWVTYWAGVCPDALSWQGFGPGAACMAYYDAVPWPPPYALYLQLTDTSGVDRILTLTQSDTPC